jgi:hypothetical protein
MSSSPKIELSNSRRISIHSVQDGKQSANILLKIPKDGKDLPKTLLNSNMFVVNSIRFVTLSGMTASLSFLSACPFAP